jgi:hypothetical protein
MMAALTVAQIRARVASALSGLSGWTQSRFPPGRFGADTDQILPLSFAVEIASTELHPSPGRQAPALGCSAESVVVVAWAYRLRGDAAVTDLDAATAAEATMLATVVGVSQADLHLTFEGAERDTTTEGWLLGEARFRALHRLSLT